MNIIIVEDELNAFNYLKKLLDKTIGTYNLLHHIESVEDAVNVFSNDPNVDLVFMDIQLADGLSFEIFNHVIIETPIIFTTAYDAYGIEAFKANGIDYLLKPVEKDELERAINKFEKISRPNSTNNYTHQFESILKSLEAQKKQRFLVKRGSHFEFIDSNEVAVVLSQDGITLVYNKKGQRYIYNKTIEQLNGILDSRYFFQINRAQIVNINVISKAHPYFNNRMKLELNQAWLSDELIVTRSKLAEFKAWMDQ